MRAHLLWATKHRRRWIDAEWRIALFEEMAAIALRHDARIICGGGIPDHVHLLLAWSPAAPLSGVVRSIKTWSSHWVRENVATRREFAWQTGFTVYTVHHTSAQRLIGYIVNQERHHGEVSRVGGWIGPRFSMRDRAQRAIAGEGSVSERPRASPAAQMSGKLP